MLQQLPWYCFANSTQKQTQNPSENSDSTSLWLESRLAATNRERFWIAPEDHNTRFPPFCFLLQMMNQKPNSTTKTVNKRAMEILLGPTMQIKGHSMYIFLALFVHHKQFWFSPLKPQICTSKTCFLSLFNTRNWTFPFKSMATPSVMDGEIKHHSMSKMLTNIKS